MYVINRKSIVKFIVYKCLIPSKCIVVLKQTYYTYIDVLYKALKYCSLIYKFTSYKCLYCIDSIQYIYYIVQTHIGCPENVLLVLKNSFSIKFNENEIKFKF